MQESNNCVLHARVADALDAHDGNFSRAAASLEMEREPFVRLVDMFGLQGHGVENFLVSIGDSSESA